MTVQKADQTPELTKAKYAVWDYFKKHNLDPGKDYTKDPVHGETITKLLIKLNKERDKEMLRYPARDLPYQLNFVKRMKKNKEAKEAKKAAKAAEEKATKKAKVTKVEETKEKKARTSAKYDYPLVDGREMTPEEKKKYRQEQRKKAKKAEKPAKEEKKAKKEKAPKAEEAPVKEKKAKDKKKDKKKHKEED